MIKIEITDPTRENPDVLVKLAAFLMECAGHTMVKAPSGMQETYNPTPQYGTGEMLLKTPTAKELLNPIPEGFRDIDSTLTPDELPPYAHCAESDLTHYTKCEETGLTEISEEALNEGLKKVVLQDTLGNLGAVIGVDPFVCEDIQIPKHDHIVSEKKKSATKRKRTPSKVEIISETGVTEITEDFIPPAPVFAPPPPINGNTLVDKIVKIKAEKTATHEEVTAIVRKHGLVAIKDIFTNDHLIPLINADLDELLRGK